MPIEPHPALNADRTELRAKHSLRSLTKEETGLPAAQLPNGVYGFTTSAATAEMAVFALPVYRCFEIQKMADGEMQLAGYVNQSDHQAFIQGKDPATILLYPDPYEKASVLTLIPASRISRKRPPLRDAGSPMQLEISPRI